MAKQKTGIHILSIDAKDIFIANYHTNSLEQAKKTASPTGYDIRCHKGKYKGLINTKLFTSVLDQSMDLIKIREVYQKVYRNSGFSFFHYGQEYTSRVIQVTFCYSNKEYNLAGNHTYVKFGCSLQDMEFKDHACIRNGGLAAIETGQQVQTPLPERLLGKHFFYKDGQYHAKSHITPIHTVEELRRQLYKNGFYCDGVKYVRYKRSGGSAREGRCLFIDERLYKPMMKWSMCGLAVRQGQEVDLAGLEAYLALPLSSIIGTVSIKPENFFIIDDYQSVFQEEVAVTRFEQNCLKTDEQTVTLKNSIWDGQSLLDVSLFQDYPGKGMLLLRNKFFKSACFSCNIQRWFRDHGITSVSQLCGFTIARDLADIKIITTPNSIKYLKFGSARSWLSHMEPRFGVVKTEKPTHFFDGRMVQTHYQLLNTLQLNEEDMKSFLQPTFDYLKLLKSDSAVLRYHIRYPGPEKMDMGQISLATKYDVAYRLLGLNEAFANTKLYDTFKNDVARAFVNNLRCGHVLVNGNYSTLLGNPVEMLRAAIGCFDGTSGLSKGTVHSKRFPFQQQLLGCRSPHVTIGNLWLPTNAANEEIDTYLNLSDEIVCVNTIGESVPDRLSGCDFDSDTVLLTDNRILLEAARKHYHMFKVPVNHVAADKRKRHYTRKEQADLDIRTSDNKIGDIINVSQVLNSILWDRMNHGASIEDTKKLYLDICQLDIMSGIEIDKAKREYCLDTWNEMKLIKNRWISRDASGRTVKPDFFGYLAKSKGYSDKENTCYQLHDTAMDYLEKAISQFQADKRGKLKKKEFCQFSDILDSSDYSSKSVYYEQVNRVLYMAETCRAAIAAIYTDNTLNKEEKLAFSLAEQKECMDKLGNMRFSKSTMIYLLKLLDSDQYRHLSRMIMKILFGCPNTSFYEVIQDSRGHIPIFMETPGGDIPVYDFHFSKILVG